MVLKKTNFNFFLSFSPEQKHLLIPRPITLNKRITANLVLKDFLKDMSIWRHVYGYPVHGQSTHTNARNARKNKKYFTYRNIQFLRLFGRTRKNRQLMQTIIKAEYTNRLWLHLWFEEWYQASLSFYKLKKRHSNGVAFDLLNLARGQVNGFVRVGAAAKLGKAKRITNRGTIGVPYLFATNLVWGRVTREFPYRLLIHTEGKRRKKVKYRKKIKKIKKKKKKKKLTL